jgi:hypothetical protein
MVRKSNKCVEHLEQAAKNLPDKNAYRNVRFYIAKALNEIADVEKHKVKKKAEQATEYEKWQSQLRSSVIDMTPEQGASAINELDKLIQQQEQRLKEINDKRQTESPGDDGILNG